MRVKKQWHTKTITENSSSHHGILLNVFIIRYFAEIKFNQKVKRQLNIKNNHTRDNARCVTKITSTV